VTLELGLALGMSERCFIAIDPGKTHIEDVPSDLRGVDRIQYSSYTDLEEQLQRLLAQEVPPVRDPEAANYIPKLQESIMQIIRQSDGIGVSAIAKLLGVNTDLIKIAVRPMVGQQLEMRGQTRGARYYFRPDA